MNSVRVILLRVLTTRVAWPILIAVGLLCATSLVALDLASPERVGRQETWLAVAAAVILLALIPHFQILGRLSYALYGVTIILLIAVFAGKPAHGTHRWFVMPGGTQLQPSELAKISFVLMLAWHLRHRKNIRSLAGLVVPFILAILPFFLILEEPDLGTALLFPLVLYSMLLAAGARMRHLLTIGLVALLAMPGAYPFLRPYQQERLKSQVRILAAGFFNRDDDAARTGSAYQQFQSMAAIGSGGASGEAGQGIQAIHQGLVPEAYTDFIFAVIGAKWGFLGCLAVLVLYLGFFAAAVEIAGSTRDLFGRLLVVGLASMILFQALINMYMTVAIAPVVGIALPFVSYGGSSLLASAIAAGLLLNVSVRRQTRTRGS